MTSPKTDRIRLQHMLDAAQKTLQFTQNRSREHPKVVWPEVPFRMADYRLRIYRRSPNKRQNPHL